MVDQVPIPISTLPSATALTGSELIPLVQSGVTKKALASLFISGGGGGGGGGGGFLTKTRLITATELEDAGSVLSWELIPALGANKVAIPVAILWHGIFNGTEFTVTAPLHVSYGTEGLSDYTALPALSVGDDHPSQDLLKQTADVEDYSVLNWQIAFGFATPDNPITPTFAPSADVVNTPVTVWTDGSTWSGGDSDLRVTIFYCEYDVSGAPTTVPSNAENLLYNGIESYNRLHPYTLLGTDFTAGNRAFGALGIGFLEIHKQSNINNPPIITKNGSNQLVINYPCVIVATIGMIGQALQTPYSAECVLSHSPDDSLWGMNVLIGGAIGTLTQPPANFNGSTGPMTCVVGEIWDGNINVEAIGPTGNLMKINQANFGIQVIQVLGTVLNWSVAAGGTGYAIGDTFQIDDGYVPAVATVTGETAGVVTSIAFADTTTSRGLGYENLTYTTTNMLPQLGSGTGLTIAVTAF